MIENNNVHLSVVVLDNTIHAVTLNCYEKCKECICVF